MNLIRKEYLYFFVVNKFHLRFHAFKFAQLFIFFRERVDKHIPN